MEDFDATVVKARAAISPRAYRYPASGFCSCGCRFCGCRFCRCRLRSGCRFRSARGLNRCRRFCRCRVLLAEFVDAAAGIHNFLLARVERMAVGTNFDLQILSDGRTGLELVPTGTSDRDLFVFRVDAGFHRNLEFSVAAESITASSGVATPWTPYAAG